MASILEARCSKNIMEVVLKRPEKKNALLPRFFREFPEIISTASMNGRYRAIVISADGDDFCSGMDISVFQGNEKLSTGTPLERERFYSLIRLVQKAFSAIESARVPVIAAIQGNCLGAGLDLVSACDIRYCTRSARFRIEETNIGIMADLGSLQRLPRLMPEGLVRELAYTGRTLSADEALRYGFVSCVFEGIDELKAGVMEVAVEIASKPPLVVSSTKRCLNYAREHSISDSLNFAALMQSSVFSLEDIVEFMKFRAGAGDPPPDLKAQYSSLDAKEHKW